MPTILVATGEPFTGTGQIIIMTNFTLTAKKSHCCTLMHAREGTTIFTSHVEEFISSPVSFTTQVQFQMTSLLCQLKAYEPLLAKPNDKDTPKHPKSLDLKMLLEWLTIFSVKVGCCNDHIFNSGVKFSRQRIAQCWGSFLLVPQMEENRLIHRNIFETKQVITLIILP